MSTELSNGVIIPEEYSDDWYDEMSINLRKLNDVITAASDNATDIQRLDTDKANSADLATVATSGSYNDLSNKPTINDSTITIQKNGSTVDTFTTNGSAKTINIPVPTKTSDLTNDSNFVDTSNSAVASGITSAKVTSYDSHVTDTDIHVTTADKTKWNNGVTQAYVLRYSSTAITDNSSIAYSTLDNTDNIKVSDKIIDTNGKIFSIVSVDSDNSTVTVGSALIDLALDANVVHTNEINSSGIGIIGAAKEVGGVDFNTLTTQGLYGANASGSTNNPVAQPCVVQVIRRLNSVVQITNVSSAAYKSRYIRYCADITAKPPVWQSWIKFAIDSDVVHKSGDETISGNKTFSSINGVEPSSLSLPSGNVSDVIDISSYISDLSGNVNNYTAPANGWISIAVVGTAIDIVSSSWSDSRLRASSGNVRMLYPVLKNETLDISITGTTLAYARFIPCQGNV